MPEYGNYAERRTAPRYALVLTGEAEALYRRTPVTTHGGAPTPGNGRFLVEILNISEGGLMLVFDAELTEGDTIQMELRHPETSKPVVLEGQIMWMRKNASDTLGRYFVGLAFRNTPLPLLQSLVSYAARKGPALN